MGTTKKTSIVKLVNSLHETSPYAYKTAPIFTAIIHNTPVDSLNQHMFCDLLQRIARFPQINKKGASPPLQLSRRFNSFTAATLPLLQISLHFNSPSASNLPPLQLSHRCNFLSRATFPGLVIYSRLIFVSQLYREFWRYLNFISLTNGQLCISWTNKNWVF